MVPSLPSLPLLPPVLPSHGPHPHLSLLVCPALTLRAASMCLAGSLGTGAGPTLPSPCPWPYRAVSGAQASGTSTFPPRDRGRVQGQAALQAAKASASCVLCVAGSTGPATFRYGHWTQPWMMEGGCQASPGQRSNRHLGLKRRVGRVPRALQTPRWHLTLLPKHQVPEDLSLAHTLGPRPESLA